MAFQQLYYTSCERGVGGYAGFQFNALSPGTGTRVMREVERLTVYELPSWDSSPADAPVNLCHVSDADAGRHHHRERRLRWRRLLRAGRELLRARAGHR